MTFWIDDPSDHIPATISRSKRFYELDLLEEVFHRTLPGMRFVDVGANIGNHTLFFSKVAGMEGVAIEPYEPNFLRLKKNLQINQLDRQVKIINAAIGNTVGRASCTGIQEHNTGTASFAEASGGGVELIPLDSLMLEEFHFLKIDVEGMELDVLGGARKTLSKFHPMIFCEAQTLDSFLKLRDFLKDFGYRPTRRFCVTPTYLFEPICSIPAGSKAVF